MNQQKDLIQHIAVLTVAPGYLNFERPRSSGILHVGLGDTKALLRECLRIMAAEDRLRWPSELWVSRSAPALAPYVRAFRQAAERIDGLKGAVWEDELAARRDLEPVVSGLDSFLNNEHWYDMGYARLLQSDDGTFYSDRSPVQVNFVPNWQCASLLFTDAVAEQVCQTLWRQDHCRTRPIPLLSLAPPEEYLWTSRTYAPQNPQSLINYWEAMLPGARRSRIRQMVSQQSV